MKLFASILMLGATAIGSASATVIQYNTEGSVFTTIGGVVQAPGSNSFTTMSSGSSATISYTSIPGTGPTAGTFSDQTLTGISYGYFTVSFTGPNSSIVIPSFSFRLLLNDQTAGATETITGTYAGGKTISQNSDGVTIDFTPTAFTLGSTSFTIQSPTILVPSTTRSGQSSIQGTAVDPSLSTGTTVASPEPGTLLLLGASLVGLGFANRKKLLNR